VCAIFVLRDSGLVEMVEQPYAAETDLQGHLAAHPELLSAEAAEDEPDAGCSSGASWASPTAPGTGPLEPRPPVRRPRRDPDLRGSQAQQ